MANQSKLKAWVRYDGTGRVVTAGPIFQANKPKVGNWRQMNIDLCCNPGGSTTTTTTQGGGGGVTPTAWVAYVASNPYSACQQNGGTSTILYTSTSVLSTGVTLYQDAALTIPYNSVVYGTSVNINGTLYALVDNAPPVISAVISCNPFTTTAPPLTFYNADYQFGGVGNPCVGTGQWNIPLEFPSGFCTSASVNLASGYTWAQYGINAGATLKVKDPNNNQYARVNVQSGSAGYNYGCNNC